MFANPFAGFRDPNDPFGLLQLAATNAAPEIIPRPVPTTRYAPDGTPLPADAPPPAPTPFPPAPTAPRQAEVATKMPEVPDERTVPLPPTSSKVPEVLTKTPGTPEERLTPTAASTAATAGNIWDKYMAMLKDPKSGPMIAALAKGFGAGNKGPAPPQPFHVQIGQTNPGFNQPNAGSAQQMLQQLMGSNKAQDKKKGSRRSEQDRYDILGGRG